MSAAPLSRSSAKTASLVAKGALFLLVPAAMFGAYLALPPIKTPELEKPVLIDPRGTQTPTTVRPVNYAAVGHVLTLAAEFPPPPPPETGVPTVPGTTPTPNAGSGPNVRFLGAIAEPGRYVALLTIDGRQKFLAPGQSFSRVRVLDCTASEVQIQIENASGSPGPRQTIAVSEREGPGWTAGTAPPEIDPEMALMQAGQASFSPANGGGLPANFTPPAGMTPQQIEQMRREFQARRQEQGDGSQ